MPSFAVLSQKQWSETTVLNELEIAVGIGDITPLK